MSRPYLTAARLAELHRTLTDRDRAVLAALGRVRVATSTQLERWQFTDITRRQARIVLASLVERRLVSRLSRRVGGVRAGSAGYVYVLDVAGQRLIGATSSRPRHPATPGWPFLLHSLAITELAVRLVEAERSGQLTLTSFTTEPACWRSFPGRGGGRVTLKPDADITVTLGGYQDQWLLEVDRGTESLPTLARQCDRYRRYWASGVEQARTGVFPRVLWIVPDARRYEQVVTVLGRQPAEAWPLFAVTLFEDAIARIVAGVVS